MITSAGRAITDLCSPTRDAGGWAKTIITWREGGRLCMSVPFTWLLPAAARRAREEEQQPLVGGPAVALMPDYVRATHKE